MNIEFINKWLNQLKDYWTNKNIDGIKTIFNKTTYYQETPFMKPYTNIDEIVDDWQYVENETIQDINFNILAVDNNTVIVNWKLKQNNEDFDGIYEIKFDDELNCIYFKSWEMENK